MSNAKVSALSPSSTPPAATLPPGMAVGIVAMVAAALADGFAGVHRYDGVTAAITPPGGADSTDDAPAPTGAEAVAQKPQHAYRDPELRLSGTAHVAVTVVP